MSREQRLRSRTLAEARGLRALRALGALRGSKRSIGPSAENRPFQASRGAASAAVGCTSVTARGAKRSCASTTAPSTAIAASPHARTVSDGPSTRLTIAELRWFEDVLTENVVLETLAIVRRRLADNRQGGGEASARRAEPHRCSAHRAFGARLGDSPARGRGSEAPSPIFEACAVAVQKRRARLPRVRFRTVCAPNGFCTV